MSSMEDKIKKQLKTFAKTLCELRETTLKPDGRCYTQQEIADKIGVRYQSYQAYERGVSFPTLKNFLKLAEIYEVSLDYLVGKSDI